MKHKKILKILFPIPTIAIMSFILVGTCIGFANGENKNFIECIIGLLFFYIFFMLPLDLVIWLIKKLFTRSKEKPLQSKNDNVYNYNNEYSPHTPKNNFQTANDSFNGNDAASNIEYSSPDTHQSQDANIDFDNMSGKEFEVFCSRLLENMCYSNILLTKESGDHGVDILCSLAGISYAIQCKCYSANIGNSAIQEVHAGKSIYKKDIAVVMTNRYFTEQAKMEAELLGVKLWDRDYLLRMVKQTNICSEERNEEVKYSGEYDRILNKFSDIYKGTFKDIFDINVKPLFSKQKDGYIEITFEAESIEQACYIETLENELSRGLKNDTRIKRIFDNRFIVEVYLD